MLTGARLLHHADITIPQLCASEARDADRGTGVVIRCLIQKVEQTSEGCARELSRVVSTALQFYEPVRCVCASACSCCTVHVAGFIHSTTQHNPVTSFCDKDVQSLCLKDAAWDSIPLGVARSCLMGSVFVSGGGGGGGNVSFELQV